MAKTKLFITNNDGSVTSTIFNDRLLAIKTGELWVSKRARAISYEVFHIYKSEFRNGSWAHPNIDDYISPDGTHAFLSPQISMSKNGDAVIVWVQYDSNDIKQIFFSEYRATPAQPPAPNMKSMPWIQLLLDD